MMTNGVTYLYCRYVFLTQQKMVYSGFFFKNHEIIGISSYIIKIFNKCSKKHSIAISLPSNSIIFAVARIQTILARSVGTLVQLQPLN